MTDLTIVDDMLRVQWPDAAADYPLIWLRDNSPDAFDPATQERVLDLLAVPETPNLQDAHLDGGAVVLNWADAPMARFDLDWLAQHRPGRPTQDAAAIAFQPWEAGFTPPRHAAQNILTSDDGLRAWMRDTKAWGLTIVEGLAGEGAGISVAERVGFLRRTNFGTTFEVMSKPDPNNLAYTSHALPLHTDLPNQEVPPGYQFLHCLENAAEGGGSVFADGVALAEALRETDPEAFDLLATVPVPFRFHDTETDIRVRRPVITLDGAGHVQELRWNAHIADVFDMEADILAAYYRAYRAYMALTREARFRVEFSLAPGEMVVFDNRRVLHGRAAFDPSTGRRHLQGCYVDRGEFDARLRKLG
ncbi:gamma-butyrobetaine hydroxylase [Jannaschia pagri]|uniref:Gamma-butyrobetaine hydroxylase n=1 Tax=Jannaschia pagri TaxID=2829797 RepID=A0ABQ4NI99_9RHOB|nr:MULTISPECIES: TauD/TfdA family dioxygenase [unclassified Jannaschia]GIT89757.1 gamma-butyrobetaine hydroxylase [Jannaschia sp. AI_61]GIT94135.1 gamma-butyrobetaine hydroxylase [Jannaschia sp. AI_62]